VEVSTDTYSNTFKVILENVNSISIVESVAPANGFIPRAKSKSASRFRFVAGNRIQVEVNKGASKSLIWRGKPTNGNLI
jgi:hypothetical protein